MIASGQGSSPAIASVAAMIAAAMMALGALAVVAQDTPTSPTLMLSVTNFEGVPQADVAVEVHRPVTAPGAEPEAARTNEFGQATITLDDARERVDARVVDPRFVAGAPIVQQTLTGPVVSFRVFAADPTSLVGPERQAFVDALPDLLAARAMASADASLANDDATLTSAGLSLFLAGVPAPVVPAAAADSVPQTAADRAITAISTRLIGPRGDAMGGVLVYLLELDTARREVLTASWQRSDATGLVLFEDVKPGAYYRLAVAPAESGFDARSTIVRARDGRAVTVPAMVLRAPGETISGFVYDNDTPASASLVVVTDATGREVLRSATDDAGFFAIGPIAPAPETTQLGVRRSTRAGVRSATVRVDPAAGDVLVPLDLLSEPGPAINRR